MGIDVLGDPNEVGNDEENEHDGNNTGNNDEGNCQHIGLSTWCHIVSIASVKSILPVQSDAISIITQLSKISSQLRIHLIIFSNSIL